MVKKRISRSFEETREIAKEFVSILKPGDLVLLHGDLGAGKTSFAQGIALGLGIKNRIISPTFVIHRSYLVEKNKINILNHLDLYRINDGAGIDGLGINEIVEDSNSLTIIEWPEKINLPTNVSGYRINISKIDEDKRSIEIKSLSFEKK